MLFKNKTFIGPSLGASTRNALDKMLILAERGCQAEVKRMEALGGKTREEERLARIQADKAERDFLAEVHNKRDNGSWSWWK